MPEFNVYDLIEEGIRERCVYEVLEEKRVLEGRTRDDLHLLFNYMYDVGKLCLLSKTDSGNAESINAHCANRIMHRLSIDSVAVNSCITNSFADANHNSINWILDRDQQLATELHISLNPTITINNHTYHGDFDGLDIYYAVCSSF